MDIVKEKELEDQELDSVAAAGDPPASILFAESEGLVAGFKDNTTGLGGVKNK